MRRLFVIYGVALTSAVLVALLVPFGLLARTLAADRAMSTARQEAQDLTVIAATAGRSRLRAAVGALNHGARRTTVFLPDGARIGADAASTPSVRLARTGQAFTTRTGAGEVVLLPVAGRNGITVIRTFVPESALLAGVPKAWATLALTGAFLLGAAAVLGAALARPLSRSVTVLATLAEQVGAGDLDATVDLRGPPEVASVGRVLNDLGARIRQMLSQERELSADLSHRLRTPVTALRLDVESLEDARERDRMSAHIDALTTAVDAAVSRARSPCRPAAPSECDADQVVKERARFWSVLADETHRRFTVATPDEPVPIGVPADLLGAALDALMDNVFNHTPAGTPFALALVVTPGQGVTLVVEDAGPGMAANNAAQPSRRRKRSTGIGLDLARRTTERAGGRVTLHRSRVGGLRVVMTFPGTLPNLIQPILRR